MTHEEIMLGVRECVARVVDKDVSVVQPEDRIISDLGADSLDLLDLVFQLEQRFKIKISPRGIEKAAQAKLGDAPLEIDGVYTAEALSELRQSLPEVPADELCEGLRAAKLPHLFRVSTFARLVTGLIDEKKLSFEPRSGSIPKPEAGLANLRTEPTPGEIDIEVRTDLSVRSSF